MHTGPVVIHFDSLIRKNANDAAFEQFSLSLL